MPHHSAPQARPSNTGQDVEVSDFIQHPRDEAYKIHQGIAKNHPKDYDRQVLIMLINNDVSTFSWISEMTPDWISISSSSILYTSVERYSPSVVTFVYFLLSIPPTKTSRHISSFTWKEITQPFTITLRHMPIVRRHINMTMTRTIIHTCSEA